MIDTVIIDIRRKLMAEKKVKYIIGEGVIDKFVSGIMNWAVKKTRSKEHKL